MQLKLKIVYNKDFILESVNEEHNNNNDEIIKSFKSDITNHESSLYKILETIYLKIFKKPFQELIDDDEQIEPFYIDYNGYIQLVNDNENFNLYIVNDVPMYNWNQFAIDAVDILNEKMELLTSTGNFTVNYKGLIFTITAKTYVKQINLM